MHGRAIIAGVFLFGIAAGQETQPPESRQEELAQQRAEKATQLKPDLPTRAEQIFDRLADRAFFDKLIGAFPGLRLKVGGLVTGSGFALGPEYYRPDIAKGDVVVRASMVGSVRRYYQIEAYLGMPRIAANRFAVDIYAKHSDYPRMPYYGPGNDSSRKTRTNYRVEESSVISTAGWRPTHRSFLLGVLGGYSLYNVGPGTDTEFPSTDAEFRALPAYTGRSPLHRTRVPGLTEQTNFFKVGPFLELDLRDSPGDPHKGIHFLSRFIYNRDQLYGKYTFRRLEGALEGYVPFFNRKRVIAVRAKTELNFRNPRQLMPFYVQPTLGGSDDLRGYRQFRFYDNNMFLMNAEYRWEVFPRLDMAVFADAGKVFNLTNEFDFHNIATSAGIGGRIKSRQGVAMRIDAAVSKEGVRVWLKFNNVF